MSKRALLQGAWAEQFAYRVDFFANVGLLGAYCGVQLLFFQQVFEFVPMLGGWTLTDVHLVFAVFIILMLCVDAVSTSVNRFFYMIHQGLADPLMVKPCSMASLMLLRWSQPALCALAAGLALCALGLTDLGSMLPRGVWPMDAAESAESAGIAGGAVAILSASWATGLAFGLAVMAGWVANVSLVILINALTYFTQRQVPVDYIHGELNRLSILPIDVFPKTALVSLMIFVPMVFGATAPVALLKGNPWPATWLGVSTAVLVALTVVVCRAASRRFDGFGG